MRRREVKLNMLNVVESQSHRTTGFRPHHADAADAVERRLWEQRKYHQAKRRLGTCSHPNLGVTRVIAPRSRRAQA